MASITPQLLQQSPRGAAELDRLVMRDLLASYDAQLEATLINAPGTAGQFDGLLTLAGTTGVTYTDATPTGSEVFGFLGNVAASSTENASR